MKHVHYTNAGSANNQRNQLFALSSTLFAVGALCAINFLGPQPRKDEKTSAQFEQAQRYKTCVERDARAGGVVGFYKTEAPADNNGVINVDTWRDVSQTGSPFERHVYRAVFYKDQRADVVVFGTLRGNAQRAVTDNAVRDIKVQHRLERCLNG